MEKMMKKIILSKTFLFVVGIILGFIIFSPLTKCEGGGVIHKQSVNPLDTFIKSKIKTIAARLKAAEKDRVKLDSLENVIPKVVHHYHTKYDSAYRAAPDTCKPYLDIVRAEHNKVDSANAYTIKTARKIIHEHDSTIKDYSDLVVLKDYKLIQKSDSIVGLVDELKFTQKKQKATKIGSWFGAALAAVFGFFVGKQ